MLRQLSVFAGGWSLEASQAVSELNTKPQDDVEVLDLLSHLVDKSLVLVDRLPDGEPRYHILATIRQYLQEKLDQAGEARSTYFAHLEYFLRLAETAEPLLVSKAQLFWLHKLDQEQDNLREALRWAQGNKLAEAALRLTGALHTYMDLHGNWDEHTRWVLSAVELGKSDPSARASLWLANALLCAGSLLNLQQNYLAGKPLLDEALQIYQQHENVVGVGRTFLQLAINAIDQFNFPVIRQYLERAMHILQDAGDHYGLALCLNLLGGAATWEWNIPAARSFFEQGLKELESVGTPNLIFASKVSLAEQLWFQGEAVQSCMILEEILPESRRYCGKNLIFHLDILGLNLLALGKYRQAQSIFEENYALTRAQGMIDWPIYTLSHFGELAFSEGNLSRARAILEEAIQQGRETSADCLPWQLWLLGQVALKEGNLEQAEALVEECIAKQAKAHFHRDEHNTYLTRGSIALEKGNIQRAGQILHDCLSMTRERHILFMAPANLEALAKLAVANGQCERSARLFAAAATLRKRFGTPLPPVEASAVQKHLEAARSSLEPAVFQSAWEWGAAQPVEDVIAYALGEVG